MQQVDKERIASYQLVIMMFVIRICAVIMYPYSFGEDMSVWGLMIPLLMEIVWNFIVIIPIIGCTSLEKHEILPPLFSGKGERILLGAVFFYRSISDLYRFNGFGTEYAGQDLSRVMITILVFIAAVYAAVKGIEGVVRFSFLVFIWIILGSIVVMSGLIPSFDINMIKNAGYNPTRDNMKGLLMLISENTELSLLFCFLSRTKGRRTRPVILWNIFSGIFLVFMLILVSGTMGEYLIGMNYPFYHITDGAGTLQRLHPVFIGIVISAFVCMLGADLLILKEVLSFTIEKEKNVNRSFLAVSGTAAAAAIILSNNKTTADMIFDGKIMLLASVSVIVILPLVRIMSILLKEKRVLIRTVSLFLAMTVMVMLFTGCSSTPLDQRIIIQGIGVDKTDGRTSLTLLTLDTDDNEKYNSIKIIKGYGNSVSSAIDNVEISTGKKCLFSQCLFVILNRYSLNDTGASLDYFSDNKEVMKTMNIMACGSNSGMILTKAVMEMDYHSEDINMISDSNAVDQNDFHCTLFDYIVYEKNRNSELKIPVISIDPDTERLCVSGVFPVE